MSQRMLFIKLSLIAIMAANWLSPAEAQKKGIVVAAASLINVLDAVNTAERAEPG